MQKLFLLFVLVGLGQWASADESEFNDYEFRGTRRSFMSSLLNKSVDLFKKSVQIQALNCNGPACSACINANIPKLVNNKGCFTVAYNGQNGPKGNINFNLNLNGKSVWSTDVKAGDAVPSCANLPLPLNEMCIQDFQINLNGQGQGKMCFTLNFKTYGFGARYCADINGRNISAANLPSIVKT